MLNRCFGPKIETQCGEIRGSTLRTRNSRQTIYAFRRIPYATPPVGKLRFRRSKPFGKWSGVLNGKKECEKSLQPNVLFPEHYQLREGSEDCLQLSVFTKSLDSPDACLPVIVFLHGGAFVVGSCECMLYGPQIILERDVVMVGVNYRLGPLGWLTLETDEAPGNLGLHDQYLALCWVRENIAAFGGDPNNVTLMGESAGAMSAMLHLVSPLSKGLFHRVIALSGAASTSFLHSDRRPGVYGRTLAQKMGCKATDPAEILQFLQKVPAVDILTHSTLFMDFDYVHPMPWAPIQDSFASEPLVPLPWQEAVRGGSAGSVPVMMGCCRDEGLILTAKFFKSPARWKLMSREWSVWSPLFLFNRDRDQTTAEDRTHVQEIKDFYWGEDSNLAEMPGTDENLLILSQICTMSWFLQPWADDSQLLAGHGSQVYNFILSVAPNFTLMDLFRLNLKNLGKMFFLRSLGMRLDDKHYGVCHGDDLCFLFPMAAPGFPPCVKTDQQRLTQTHLLDFVSSFAEAGIPRLAVKQEEAARVWRPLSASGEYLDISETLTMKRDPELDRQVKFWNRIKAEQRRELSTNPITTFHTKIAIHRANHLVST